MRNKKLNWYDLTIFLVFPFSLFQANNAVRQVMDQLIKRGETVVDLEERAGECGITVQFKYAN